MSTQGSQSLPKEMLPWWCKILWRGLPWWPKQCFRQTPTAGKT